MNEKYLDDFIENENLENSISEIALSEATKELVKEFIRSKNFSRKQIKAISLLCSVSGTMNEILSLWIENMIHLKGKRIKDSKDLIKEAFKGLGNIVNTEKQGFFSNIFHRDK